MHIHATQRQRVKASFQPRRHASAIEHEIHSPSRHQRVTPFTNTLYPWGNHRLHERGDLLSPLQICLGHEHRLRADRPQRKHDRIPNWTSGNDQNTKLVELR